jgi:post-segregation antitoxin (ccd killing protein)
VGQAAAKLSVSVPSELAAAVRRRVGARGLSGFVARAMAHELEREQLRAFLAELERDLGPVSKTELSKARRAWPKR